MIFNDNKRKDSGDHSKSNDSKNKRELTTKTMIIVEIDSLVIVEIDEMNS